MEMERQRHQTKRPDQPLLSLLAKLRNLPVLKKRLEAIVEETHQFIAPSRTSIYWFESHQRFFWRRLSNRDKTASSSDPSNLLVQELGGFYQALTADQVVSIGEALSSLKADITGRLMQQIQLAR